MVFVSSPISVENVTAGPKTSTLRKRLCAPGGCEAKAKPACLALGHEFVAFILTVIRVRVAKRRRKPLGRCSALSTLVLWGCRHSGGIALRPLRHKDERTRITRGSSLVLHCRLCFADWVASSNQPGFTHSTDCDGDFVDEPPLERTDSFASNPGGSPGDKEDPFCAFWQGHDNARSQA